MHKNNTIPLLCQYGLFINKYVSENAIVYKGFSTYFDITLYAEAAIYTKKLLLSHYIGCYFKKITQVRLKSKINKVWHRWMGWKMPLSNWHTLWMVPWLTCCFTVILFYIVRKWLLMINLGKVLPFQQCFWWKYRNYEK